MPCAGKCAAGRPRKAQRATFGALAFFVGMEDVEALDGKIRNLETDVMRITGEPPKNNEQAIANARLLGSWAPFRSGWKQWVADHYSTLSRTGQGAVTEFENFQSRYNELRRRSAELGKVSASVSRQEVTGGGAPEITSAVKWASVAVVAVVGAYLVSKAT